MKLTSEEKESKLKAFVHTLISSLFYLICSYYKLGIVGLREKD